MLKFAKGSAGSSKSPTRTPDTLNTTDTVELLLGFGEGPIKGFVDGPKSFYTDGTALLNSNGQPNYSSFALQFWPGNEEGHTVKMELGGFSNPIDISQTLAQNTPVIREGVTTGIDAIDFRIVVQQLLKQNDDGIFTAPLSLKFEIKKTTEPTWQPAWLADVSSDVPDVDDPGGIDAIWQYFGAPTTDIENSTNLALTGSTDPTAPLAPGAQQVRYVNNANGSVWEWGDGQWDQVSQSAPQDDGGFTYTEDDSGQRTYTGPVAPVGARAGDTWATTVRAYVFDGVQWVDNSQFVQIIPQANVSGVWSIDAKVSSPTAKDLRVFVEADPTARWEFRVTKLSQDTDTEITSIVSWESVQEIKRAPMTFHGVSMARVIGKASDQFTALPEWSADTDGRIVKVPSNYNPETRAYSGIWDGTYQLAWTNNPAFIFQDFVENTTYGLSSLFVHTVNKWKIYEWAQYCDTPVDRSDGGKRPRWTYNDFIQQPRDAKEMAQYIAGAAGGRYVDDGNGVVDVIIDQDEDAVVLFTPENVGSDGFSYSYTDRLTRSNQVIVEFVNPALNWQADQRLVKMDEDIASIGIISENFIAVGCTDEEEALARARRRLIGGLTEKEMVTFTTNRQGRFLSEMEVILIADPDMGRALTGRIREKLSSSSVSLRDPITLEAAVDYEATFTIVDEEANSFATITVPVTSSAGTHTTLTFGGSLPDTLPDKAPFAISAPGFVGVPKPYRVTGIDDDSGNGEMIRITALELNRNKYAYIDTGVYPGDIDYGSSGEVQPPTNLRVLTEIKQRGTTSSRVATLMWDRSATKFVRTYEIAHLLDGVTKPAPAPTTDTKCEFEGITDGEHIFSVVAVDLFGKRSKPAVIRYNTNGVIPVHGQFNFRLTNGINDSLFETLEPAFAWDQLATLPNFDHWEILVYHPTLDVVLRVEDVGTSLQWTYRYAANKSDHDDAPPRELRIGLRAVDQYGNSSFPDELTVTNPAPPAPTGLSMVLDGDAFQLTWARVAVQDFGGTRVFVKQGGGSFVLASDGTGPQARIPLFTSANYTVRVGHYDLYRPDETIFAADITQDVDKLAKDLIDDLEEAAQAVHDLQDYVDNTLLPEIQGIENDAEKLAETLISGKVSALTELAERERMTYLGGQEMGVYVQHVEEKTDTSIEILDMIGVRTEDGLAFRLNDEALQVTDDESLYTRLNEIENRFGGSSSSTLLDQINVALDDSSAAIDTLAIIGAKTEDGDGFILDTAKVHLDETESLIDRLSQTEARFGGSASSTLLTQINATASSTAVAARALSHIGVEIDGNTAFQINDSQVKVSSTGQSLSTWVQSMQVSSGTIDARADNRISLSLGPGGSIASSINSVASTAGAAYSSASVALNAVNGNDASIIMLTQVGGKVTGTKINGSTGDFGILASRFYVVDDSGGSSKVPFLISGGVNYLQNTVVDGSLFVNGTITGNKIVGGAITGYAWAYVPYGGALSTSSALVATLTYTTEVYGSPHTFDITPILSASGGNCGVEFQIYRDSTLIGNGGYVFQSADQRTISFFDQAPSGGHTYYIYANKTVGSGTLVWGAAGCLVEERKK